MDVLLKTTSSIGSFGPLVTTFLIGFTTIFLLLCYSLKKQSYWRRLGIPYVRPYPFIGTLLGQFRRPLQDLELERYKKYGRIYGHFEGNTPLLSVAEPELLRNILVKDFQSFPGRRILDTGDKIAQSMLSIMQGEDWKRVRTIVSPTFTTGKIKRMLGIFKECSRTLVKNFKEAALKGEYVEAKKIYGAFTMDIIASSAFSTKIDSHNDPNNEFVVTAREAFTININLRFLIALLLPKVAKFFGIALFNPRVSNFFTNATLQIIEERKRTGQTRNDFLQLLMDTAKELQDEGKLNLQEKEKDNDMIENYGNEENKEIFKNVTKKTLSNNELVAQCVIFFLAGYDTTASTLAFTTYNMALYPEVQERVIKELDEALRETNGELTYEVVQSLKTLDNVISETLRLFPPLSRTERFADEDYKLGDTGIIVPKGMIVTVPVISMHMDPEYFPDPEKFDPDRFAPEERAKRNPYVYLPFGAGPRNCVAMRFALMEVKVCLIHVLSNFRIKRCPETKVPLEYHLGQGLLQPKEINVKFEIRNDTVKAL